MNFRENRRENQKWTIQGHGQYWVHKTQTKKHNREKEDEQHGHHKKKPGERNQLLKICWFFFIWYTSSFSNIMNFIC